MMRLGRNTSHFLFVEYVMHYEVFRLTFGYADVKSSLRDFRCARALDFVARRPSSLSHQTPGA